MTTLTAHGCSVELNFDYPDDHISRVIERGRTFYEIDLLEDIHRRITPGTAIDVGAHIGNHTLWLAAVCGMDVVAFEPFEPSRQQLERNIDANGLRSRVQVRAAAAGDKDGTGRIVPGTEGNSGTTTIKRHGRGSVAIETIDGLALEEVRVIKIDVEGGELAVLKGARDTIARCRPVVYVEAATDERRAAVDALMSDLGYAPFGCFAKTPTYGYAPVAPVVLSVAVMAHPSRKAFVQQLLERLDAPAEVVWDQRGDRWDTGRRSLLAADPSATHHLVIQDDSIVCRDLVAGARRALTVIRSAPVSFYAGRQRPAGPLVKRAIASARKQGASWVYGELLWGVALAFPAPLIPEMVKHGDTLTSVPNYDRRLSMFLRTRRIPTFYTLPSLVDHRNVDENPSLVPGRTAAGRVAHWFAGADASALDLDWSGPREFMRTNGAQAPRCPACKGNDYSCSITA